MRKVISFDLDDVIYDCTEPFVKYINKKYGRNVKFSQIREFKKEYFKLSAEEEAESWSEFLYSDYALRIKPNKHALEALRKLKEKYRIIIVTKRDYELQEAAKKWANRHIRGLFDKLYFTKKKDYKIDKSGILKKEKAILHIDDKIKNIKDCVESSIPCLLIEKPWSKHFKGDVARAKAADYGKIIKILD